MPCLAPAFPLPLQSQVEMALPWSLLAQVAGGRRTPPHNGDAWRINFSK
jgi:hypothetical protein